jgi:hypothetical protein
MAVCLAWQAAIGAQFSQGKGDYSKGIAGVASFFCFSWAFSWSYGPVSWVSLPRPGFSRGLRGMWVEGVADPPLVLALILSIAHTHRLHADPQTYQSEIFPMHLRSYGCSASTAANWVNNVIIGQITPIGLAQLNYKYFFVFIATNVSNTIVAYFLFPETKNKTLEEIGLMFGDTDVRTMPENRHTLVGGGAGQDVHKVISGEEKGEVHHVNVADKV